MLMNEETNTEATPTEETPNEVATDSETEATQETVETPAGE